MAFNFSSAPLDRYFAHNIRRARNQTPPIFCTMHSTSRIHRSFSNPSYARPRLSLLERNIRSDHAFKSLNLTWILAFSAFRSIQTHIIKEAYSYDRNIKQGQRIRAT